MSAAAAMLNRAVELVEQGHDVIVTTDGLVVDPTREQLEGADVLRDEGRVMYERHREAWIARRDALLAELEGLLAEPAGLSGFAA